MTKILFVCSANVDRSPTAEHIYKDHPALEVISAGAALYATRPVTKYLLQWADVVLCMEEKHKQKIMENFKSIDDGKIIDYLNIDDDYPYGDPELIKIIKTKVDAWLKEHLNIV